MKSIVILLLLSLLITTSCKNKAQEQKNVSNNIENAVIMNTIELTKAEFFAKVANIEESSSWKYKGDLPCIIDFYASWCGPCKSLAPVLEELAKEYAGKIYIYKVNTENEQELAALFGIRSIPTLLFCPMTGEPQMEQGALPKVELVNAINGFLLKK